jgi:hypothetical protein
MIETDRRTVAISWTVAVAVALLGGLLLWLMPLGAQTGIKKPAAAARPDIQKKAQRKKLPLPADIARKMMDSSEVLVRRELKARLKRFKQMAEMAFQKEDALLDLVDQRPGAPAINDTSSARGKTPSDFHPLPNNASVEALYARLAELETDIQENHLASEAAKKALQYGLSFPDTLQATQLSMTRMPGYTELVSTLNQQHGQEGAQLAISSVDDINRYRELLGQTTRQSGLAESRLFGMVSEIGRRPPPSAAGSPIGKGDGDGQSASLLSASGKPMVPHDAKFESEAMVGAQALPGRRFTRETLRQGWLYVNTWYMIGPWEGHGRSDFSLTHSPESAIDLDAVYYDGQRGEGIAEIDSHPLRVDGETVQLDGTLRWKFMQSESMHNTMPVTTDSSVYYAYTELYFDEAATMIVAIGTDDSGKLWINDKEIWQDTGASWYHIDEHIEAFTFNQGWNRILVRLDNIGGAAAGFSFLVCPENAVAK